MEQTNGNQLISRRTKIQMLELLSQYDGNPGMTVKDFCRLHQISEGSFYSARKRHRCADTSKQKSSGFISIGRPSFKEPTGVLFAEVNGIKLFQAVPAEYLKALVL